MDQRQVSLCSVSQEDIRFLYFMCISALRRSSVIEVFSVCPFTLIPGSATSNSFIRRLFAILTKFQLKAQVGFHELIVVFPLRRHHHDQQRVYTTNTALGSAGCDSNTVPVLRAHCSVQTQLDIVFSAASEGKQERKARNREQRGLHLMAQFGLTEAAGRGKSNRSLPILTTPQGIAC